MRLRQTLICFFFLSTLRDGSTALFGEDIGVRTGTEGEKITVGCNFNFFGSRKVFCRDDCEDGDILVETLGVRNQRGSYSIKYKEGSLTSLINVSITNLKKSDSGRYSCWLDRSLFPDSTKTFELRVKDAPTTTKPNWTPQRFPASTSLIGTTSTLGSTSTRSTTSTPSHRTNEGSEGQTSGQDLLLYLALLLVLLLVIFSVILLIYCKKRSCKPKEEATGPPINTEYADVSEANRVYEEVKEDKPNKSPPGNISTVYTCAKFSKPPDDQHQDEYSLAGPQIEDDSGKLTYSMVDFSNSPAASHSRAPADRVIYSVPRVDANSEDALYSNVTLN